MRLTGFRPLPLRFLAGLLAVLALAGAAWADGFSASAEGGYGRILFTLDPAGTVKARQNAGILILDFSRKVAILPEAVAHALPGYIVDARADAGGKTFRLALVRPVRLHVSADAGRVAVDLLPDGFSGTPPELKTAKPQAPKPVDVAKLAAVKVRSGLYQHFTRIVFDWPRPVSYRVFPGAGRLTVRFAALGRPDFSAITRETPPWVKAAGWHLEGTATVVDLAIDPDSGFHDFDDGNHVVIDVLAPGTHKAAYRPPGDGKAQGSAPPPPASASVTPSQAREIRTAAEKLNHTTLTPVAVPLAQTAPSAPGVVAVKAVRRGGTVMLTFPGVAHFPVAAFSRGAAVWIVFAGAPDLDVSGLDGALGDEAAASAVSKSGIGVVRLILKTPPAGVAAAAVGADLKVTLGVRPAADKREIGFTRGQDDSARAVLTASPDGVAKVVLLNDPLIKDRLVAIPTVLGERVEHERRFVDFSLLPTAAGVAMVPFADDVAAAVENGKIVISSAAGLALTKDLSPVMPQPESATANAADFLDFAVWARPSAGSFLATERNLRMRAARASGRDIQRLRLELAEFYLSNGFSAEALGLIDLLQAAGEAPAASAKLQMMRAVADYGMGRYQEASNAIAGAVFDADRHAALWRGLIAAAMDRPAAAFDDIKRAEPELGRYRQDIQIQARLAAAESALTLGRFGDAKDEIDRLPESLSVPLKARVDLARARLAAAWNRPGEADLLFAAAEEKGDERTAAEAIYDRVDADLKAKRITEAQAINALERLRFRWRGDGLEVKTLNRLAGLYFRKNRWRDGLRTLQAAAKGFPNSDAGRKADDEMRAAFADLFLKGKADTMAPIDALGLFYDFADLTPIGQDGDEMIRRMSDRLAKVDLMGPAVDLLKYQVTRRLDGTARAQVAVRLAMLQLADHQAEAALDTLVATQISALPDDVNRQRLLLKARALSELKRYDEALDLIAVDKSADVAKLRAEIYWQSGKWPEAGKLAESSLDNRWHDAAPLSDEERQTVLRAAIAYSLAGDEPALTRIRARFTAKMRDSGDGEAFAVLTQRIDTHGLAFREAAAKVASIDTLKSFMKNLQTKKD
jgi:hypothetical protein